MPIRSPLPPLACLPLVLGCASAVENRDPVGERFPSVVGESLEGEEVRVPEDFAGEPVLLLVGYEMDAQFDLDRWILGLLQAQTAVRFLEVPTIPGLVPGLFADDIDEGMRSGIPSEDWAGVVTVYGDDAERVVATTGNETPRNGRVLLLDEDGRIVWFHDRGYSASKLLELDAAVEAR